MAKRLIENFKESEFFEYNPEKNCVFAKSFKSKCAVIYGRKKYKKYTAFADYCRKMQLDDNINLRKAVQELRNILSLCVIDAVDRQKDNLNVGFNQSSFVTKPESSTAIPQRKIAFAIGLSRSSACRYIKRLIDNGRVSKSGIVAECVIECLNGTTEKEWRNLHPKKNFAVWHDVEHGGYSGWAIYGYAYSIANRKDSDAFQHVIYNYKRENTIKPTCSSELDGRWK